MSVTVRRSPVLICLREEVVRAIRMVTDRRKEAQFYLQSHQVVHTPSRKQSLRSNLKLAEYSTQEKSLLGLTAGFAILDFLNKIYKNLQDINIFLQQCSGEDFYHKVGKITKYTDLVLFTLREEQRSRLKYKGLQQRQLMGPGIFEKPYTQRLKQLAKDFIWGTIRTRDSFMEKVSGPETKKRKIET